MTSVMAVPSFSGLPQMAPAKSLVKADRFSKNCFELHKIGTNEPDAVIGVPEFKYLVVSN